MKRIVSRTTGFILAAVGLAYLLILAAGAATASARSGPLPGQRLLLGRPLLGFGTEIIIALVGTALILGIAILFTPREPPAWQKAELESRMPEDPFADTDDEVDEEAGDEVDEGLSEDHDQEWDDDDWRTAA